MQKEVQGTFRPDDIAYVEGLLTALLTGESVCDYTTGKTGKRVLAKFQRMRAKMYGERGTVRYCPSLDVLSKLQLAGLHGIFTWQEMGVLLGRNPWTVRSAVCFWEKQRRRLEEPTAEAAE